MTTITVDGKQTEIEQQSAKAKSSLRTLPLIGSFREYFLQVKEAQELNKQICGNCYNHEYDGFVFVDELGERMRANYLTSAFPKFLEDHGLRRMRFHDLRHPYVKPTTKKFLSFFKFEMAISLRAFLCFALLLGIKEGPQLVPFIR